MKLTNLTTAAVAACPPICLSAYPKLLIASDSTTARNDNGALQGWGAYIPRYLNVSVLNLAKNGRSARSYINDGLWKNLLELTQPGDFVLIEMGLNDEGDPASKNNTRAFRNTFPGTGDESVELTYHINATTMEAAQGRTPVPPPGLDTAHVVRKEKVHTFGWYLKQMIVDLREKQAIPILSGRTPGNNWSGNGAGATLETQYKFRDYAQQVSEELKTDFVDHTHYSLKAMLRLGQVETKKFFPSDKTHTNAKGAELFAEAFVQAARCAGAELADYLNEEAEDVDMSC